MHDDDPRGLRRLVESEDLDALVRVIDGICAARDWDELDRLRHLCRAAVERGRQTWNIALLAEYRLALIAPAPHSTDVLDPGAGRFGFGPLTEVVAQYHRWDDLADTLPGAHVAATVAQERVLRGEDLRDDPRATSPTVYDVYGLPMCLAPGETGHALPLYRDDGVHVPDLREPARGWHEAEAGSGRVVDSPQITRAWRDISAGWVDESNGSAVALAADTGDVTGATGHLSRHFRLAQIDAAEAIVRLTWLGSSGGAHGRRHGGAAGRFSAWWTVAEIAGIDWPPDRDGGEFLTAADALDWYAWEPLPPPHGWCVGLAASNPVEGWSAACVVTDVHDERLSAGTDPLADAGE